MSADHRCFERNSVKSKPRKSLNELRSLAWLACSQATPEAAAPNPALSRRAPNTIQHLPLRGFLVQHPHPFPSPRRYLMKPPFISVPSKAPIASPARQNEPASAARAQARRVRSLQDKIPRGRDPRSRSAAAPAGGRRRLERRTRRGVTLRDRTRRQAACGQRRRRPTRRSRSGR